MFNPRNETLARMLTKQNVTVVYSDSQTAYVDLKSNTINLPVFDSKYSEYVEDFLLLHEILHIMHTPKAQYEKAANLYGNTLINVLEDIRIEYLGRNNLPGILPIFQEAAARLAYETPLFDVVKTPEKLDTNTSLLSRMNVYFRFGHLIRVPFAADEIPLVKEAMGMREFNDLVELAKKMVTKNTIRSFKKQDQNKDKKRESGCDEENGIPESSESSEDVGSYAPSPEELITDEVKSTSVESFVKESTLEEELKNKKILSHDSRRIRVDRIDDLSRLVKSFNGGIDTKTLPFVENLVTFFNLKKNALSLKKQSFKKKGVIDTNRLASYKINDNIFQTHAIKDKEKNHGFICFIDFSSSMIGCSDKVMWFVLALVEFFEKIDVPYQVYGWGDSYMYNTNQDVLFSMIHIISSSDTKATKQRAKQLMAKAKFGYGGTPLMAAAMQGIVETEKFMKANRVNKMNALWITDGCGGGSNSDKYYVPGTGYEFKTSEFQQKEVPMFAKVLLGKAKTTALHIDTASPAFFKEMPEGSASILVDPSKMADQIFMRGIAREVVEGIL